LNSLIDPGMRSIHSVVTEALRTKYWCWILRERDAYSNSLLTFLHQNLPHIQPDSWGQRFAFGGVYVNGRDALGDIELPLPCKIEYYEPKFDIPHAAAIFPEFRAEYLFYRDDDIIAVYKPPGLSSMPAKEQRHFSVKASVERLTGARVHMPSRLDVSAQGLIIMSISERCHGPLQQIFEQRQITKEYICASGSHPTWSDKSVELPIGRDASHPVLRKIDTINGKPALTEFSLMGRVEENDIFMSVFRAKPVTGRTHQIRVHAAASGIPLIGDRFYGGMAADYLHLIGYAVTLTHPVRKDALRITLPENFLPKWAL
jgi:tRNA pseudouridine32 synthase/23S rRNA pseudouridine746 synthase